jgi:hypothetical protein
MIDFWLTPSGGSLRMTEIDPTKKGFAEEIGYGEAERAERAAFVRLTPEECALLRSLRPVMEPFASSFVQSFYEHLLRFNDTRDLLAEDKVRKRLLIAQRDYLVSLFSGEYGPAHYESRLRIGFTHERIRLHPKWYLGAYALYISLLTPLITDHFSDDPARGSAAVLALHKILNLDMQLAMESYMLASRRSCAGPTVSWSGSIRSSTCGCRGGRASWPRRRRATAARSRRARA